MQDAEVKLLQKNFKDFCIISKTLILNGDTSEITLAFTSPVNSTLKGIKVTRSRI